MPLAGNYCSACGQQRAKRLDVVAIGNEAWQKYRLFEFTAVKAAWRLLRHPGHVARDFVMGVRKRHEHPLKLLLIAIGVLLLVLSQTNYLDSRDASLSKAMSLIRSYGNWSFSLGIVAISAASMSVMRWGKPYNLTEHLVLATYAHFLIIVASIVNLLPTLVWRAPEFLATHKASAAIYMDVAEAGIVMLAFHQFFAVTGWRSWLRLIVAVAAFVVVKWVLTRLYAMLIAKLVLAKLTG
ncbi:MAG: DUF3667 domain-containing protein [Rhodanobacteraceae bacterium]|nr:DUF3667 domain-containing protein [Rhodanobacteraceae bacterium]